MPDNQGLLRQHLGKLGLGSQREEEIIRELSEHLEDHAAALETRGVARQEAVEEALKTVPEWSELRNEILSAETEEATMNYQGTYRTKILWLPALGALTLSSSLLALLQFSGLVPRFYWLSDRMSGADYFTFYVPWLIALPVVGAVAALWSKRAGGEAIHRLLAALAPPIGLLGFFLISPFLTLLMYVLLPLFVNRAGHRQFAPTLHAPPLTGLLVLLVSWILLPAVALLLGAAPFLRKPHSQSSGYQQPE